MEKNKSKNAINKKKTKRKKQKKNPRTICLAFFGIVIGVVCIIAGLIILANG